MSDELKSVPLTPALHEYLVAHGTPPDDALRGLIERTEALGGISRMQVSPEQGALLTVLATMLAATNAVEVGTFTGYSSTCIARGLAPGGRLLCCDVSEEWTDVARAAWAEAGVADRIELRIAPAIETLRALPADEPLDLVFIDADKGGYLDYYETVLPLVRPGGVVAIDNVLWGGRVVDETDHEADTEAIRRFNRHVADDPRVQVAMVPVADGLTLAVKH
ncbi:SAM-dependent methyltransferase [cyanobacterium TDX16]|nr:SAM-dependent methyltransferase [cyanobacterium TDX16]